MKCAICKREFRDKEKVVPVLRYIVNERRGDFVAGISEFIHLAHIEAAS
jgi:hypothetical protein